MEDKLKIAIKLFSREEMFNGVKHSIPVNPIEYILPCIDTPYELVSEDEADVILCSIYTVGYNEFQEWYNRGDKSGKKIIVGGYHPSLCPEDFEEYNVTVIVGPGESVISEAITGNKKLIYGKHIDVVPRRLEYTHIIDLEGKKIINVRTMSGCNRKCDYCCHPIVYPDIFVFGIDNIIKDIEDNNPEMMFITDGNFLISPLFYDTCDIAINRGIELRFYGTVDDLNERMVEKINQLRYSEIIVGLQAVN